MAATSNRCRVYARTGKLPKAIRDCLGEVKLVTDPPTRADFYVTGSNLSSDIERKAARLDATVVILPEASGWLHQQVVKKPTAVIVWHSP